MTALIAVHQPIHQQPHPEAGSAGAAVGAFLFLVGRAGDVDVGPGGFFGDEAAEELRALQRAGLAAGSELEVTADDLGIRLERVAAGPRLVKVGRRLVARPTVAADSRPTIDIAALVEDERNRWP